LLELHFSWISPTLQEESCSDYRMSESRSLLALENQSLKLMVKPQIPVSCLFFTLTIGEFRQPSLELPVAIVLDDPYSVSYHPSFEFYLPRDTLESWMLCKGSPLQPVFLDQMG
jgi:hypothetical protein